MRLRFRSVLNNLSSTPLRVLPSTPHTTFTDPQFLWYLNDRLLLPQPAVDRIRGKTCNCNPQTGQVTIADGHHLRVCQKGGGVRFVHNRLRDRIRDVCAAAGLVARTEVPGLLPGTLERPGDVVAYNWPHPNFDRCAIDVTITDTASAIRQRGQRRLRETQTGIHAVARETAKANHRPGGTQQPPLTQRLRHRGVHFVPLAFEVGGATGKSWSPFIKKLSEIAHERRGYPPSSFRVYWTNQVAVTLAKTGAQAALFKLHRLRARRLPEPPAPVPALDFLALAAPDPSDLGSSSAPRS